MGRKRIGGGNEDRRIRINEEAIICLFYEGRTAVEIAQFYGCSTFPIKKAMRRLGLRRPAARRAGVGCGESNPSWKGGRRQRTDGYWIVWTTDGERLEHRVIMEKHLCRPLSVDEIIHHIDGDKSNNTVGNLMLMSQSEHVRLHAPDMHAARYNHG